MCSIFLLMGFFSSNIFAQDSTEVAFPCEGHSFCSLQTELELLYETSPAFQAQCEENCGLLLEEVFQHLASDSVFNDSIVIPVVFHVIYGCESAIENISEERIVTALNKVNADFQGLTACEGDTVCDIVYPDRLGSMNIQFQLAEKDPYSNPTNGITRTKSNATYMGWASNPKLKQLIMWPRDQYLNIYIVNKTNNAQVSGLAFYPETSHDNPQNGQDDNNVYYDGVTMAHWAVAPVDSTRFNYSYVLSHEIGHWLGLRHIWGDLNSPHLSANCEVDDFGFVENFLLTHPSAIPNTGSVEAAIESFNDTPNTIGHYISYPGIESCVPVEEENTCPDVGVEEVDMYDNFMDYTPCAKMFSSGQILYMQNVLNSSVADRNKLHTPENIAAVFYDSTSVGRMVCQDQSINEYDSNVGEFMEGIAIELVDLNFIPTDGYLPGNAFIIEGIPEGLNGHIAIYNNDSAALFLEGVATNHHKDTLVRLVFLQDAFTGSLEIPVENRSKYLTIDFIEESGWTYDNFDVEYSVGPSESSYHLVSTDLGVFEFKLSESGEYYLDLPDDFSVQFAVEAGDNSQLYVFEPNDSIDQALSFASSGALSIPTDGLETGDEILIGFAVNACGYGNRYGCMRFYWNGESNNEEDSCESLILKDMTYASTEGLIPLAGVLPEPVLTFSDNLREGFTDNGIFSEVSIFLEGITLEEGFDSIYFGQVLPNSVYSIVSESFPNGFDSTAFQLQVLDFNRAVLSIEEMVNLEDSEDFQITLSLYQNAFQGNPIEVSGSNEAVFEETLYVDFVGPFHFDFQIKNQSPVNAIDGDYQAYVFYLDHLTDFPTVEVGMEYYGNGYLFYSPDLSEVKVEILCDGTDSMRLQFFDQQMLDSLNVDLNNFKDAGPGAYYPDTGQPFEGEVYFSNEYLSNWGKEAAYFLLRFTYSCGESYYAWMRMEIEDGHINIPYVSYYTEPNTLLDLFPVCEAYGVNPEDGEFIWCEGIQLEGIQSFPNGYDVEDGYSDFIGDLETTLEYGKSYELLLYRGGIIDYNHYWYVWIDLDRDGVFSTDSSELLVDSLIIGGTEYEFIQTNISIPQTVEPGFYTLRIASSLYDDATGCGAFTYGEVEDYSIEVVDDNCLAPDWKPRIYASRDTFCLDSLTLELDALPNYFTAEWILDGNNIASTDTTILWIHSAGWYQVYYQSVSDTTCVSMLSDSFQIFDRNCGAVDSMIIDTSVVDSFVSLNAKVFLQGALWGAPSNDLMRDDLRELNLLPLIEPFSTMQNLSHYGNGGGETVDSSFFEAMGDTAIVDWLLLELRSDDIPEQILQTQSVLLQKNGTVVDVEGNSDIVFDELVAGDYFVSIRHRNHLGAMTATVIGLNADPVLIDFTNTSTPLWGEDACVLLDDTTMALWAGNSSLDDLIVFQGLNNESDPVFFSVLSAEGNQDFLTSYIQSDYAVTDVNLDGQTILQGNNNDPTFIFFNVLTHPQNELNLPGFIIEEQVP